MNGMNVRDFVDDQATARQIEWSLQHGPLEANRVAILTYLVRRRSGSKPLSMSSLRSTTVSLSGWAEHLDQVPLLEATREHLDAYLAKEAHVRHYWNPCGGRRNECDRLVRSTEANRWKWKIHLRTYYRLMHPQAARRLFEGLRIGRQPSRKVQRSQLVTREELARVVAMRTNACDRAMLLTLYETGFRLGELCSLNVGSITFEADGVALACLPSDGKDLKTGARTVPVLE